MGALPLTAREMAVVEANAIARGVALDILMENAGRAVAEEVARHLPAPAQRVAVIAGSGNNGGDGFCAAFYLGQWGYAPEVWLLRPATELRSGPSRRGFGRIASRYPVHNRAPNASELGEFPLLVDAMLGIGARGPLRAPYLETARAMNASGVPILSVDVPSGIGGPDAVRPKWTVALTAPKTGSSPESAGEVVVREIGIPREALEETGPGEFLLFPEPSARSRGRSARIVVIGGGPYSGAPALAALAALRSGSERATVFAPAPAADAIRNFSPNLVVQAIGTERFLPEDVPRLRSALAALRPGAALVGMGSGRDRLTHSAFEKLFEGWPESLPLLVDADALDALLPRDRPSLVSDPRRVVVTPNRGEYLRVFAVPAEEAEAVPAEPFRQRAERAHVTLAVKGAVDVLTDGERVYRNRAHTLAMTVAGAGDVFAGVIGSLLAQGLPAIEAVRLGSYWVGVAGSRATQMKGWGLLATDILEELPAALVEGQSRVRPESP